MLKSFKNFLSEMPHLLVDNPTKGKRPFVFDLELEIKQHLTSEQFIQFINDYIDGVPYKPKTPNAPYMIVTDDIRESFLITLMNNYSFIMFATTKYSDVDVISSIIKAYKEKYIKNDDYFWSYLVNKFDDRVKNILLDKSNYLFTENDSSIKQNKTRQLRTSVMPPETSDDRILDRAYSIRL